ncbi:MAG TPA: hypothetical protein DCE71_06665 [Parachlamydiales bacterium]|nr:hypothetical protein [Parachlamydiales bacterium]
MGCIQECKNFFKTLTTDMKRIDSPMARDPDIEEMKIESIALRIAGVVGVVFASCIALSALFMLPFAPISTIVSFSVAALIGVGSHDAIQIGINESSLIRTLDTLNERDRTGQFAQAISNAAVLAKAGLSEYNGVPWKLQGTWLFKEIAPLL